MIADRRRGHDLQTMLVKLRRIKRDVIDDDDDLRIGRLARIEAQRAGPAGDDEANIAVAFLVDLDGMVDGFGHLLAAHGDLEPDGARALIQSVDVFLEPEDLAVVNADAFEDAVAVEEAMVVDADLGVVLVVELAVDVDFGHLVASPRIRLTGTRLQKSCWPE